jgi:hypothetical protein
MKRVVIRIAAFSLIALSHRNVIVAKYLDVEIVCPKLLMVCQPSTVILCQKQ